MAQTWIDGPCCAREDLATMLLDQLDDDRSVREGVAVTSPGPRISTLATVRCELLR